MANNYTNIKRRYAGFWEKNPNANTRKQKDVVVAVSKANNAVEVMAPNELSPEQLSPVKMAAVVAEPEEIERTTPEWARSKPKSNPTPKPKPKSKTKINTNANIHIQQPHVVNTLKTKPRKGWFRSFRFFRKPKAVVRNVVKKDIPGYTDQLNNVNVENYDDKNKRRREKDRIADALKNGV